MGRTVSNAPECAPSDDFFDPRIDDFVSKERNYIHFDLQLSEDNRKEFSLTDSELASHAFWPLLGYDAKERVIKFDKNNNKYYENKTRKIKFGSHKDAAVLELYTKDLSQKYENYLANTEYSHCILAYRSNVGDNVAQAGNLFAEIKIRENTIAIAMDVKKFFDNIDHQSLKNQLLKLFEKTRLSKAHFHVFDTMTRFSWVDSDKLKDRLGEKYGNRGRICTSAEFRKSIRTKGHDNLVETNSSKKGIPQGTPLSGLYANIALLEFDKQMFEFARQKGGSYRRYSDDLAFLIPVEEDVETFAAFVEKNLKSLGLWLNASKTETSVFRKSNSMQSATAPFQYLGFIYDGESIRIRESSLNRYYRKMRKGVHAKIRAAHGKGVNRDEIYMRKLFQKYTHFGKGRNFPRYAYRAERILNAPKIRHQLKGHIPIFKRVVRESIEKVYGQENN